MTDEDAPVPACDNDVWTQFRKHTVARIGLARSGAALATKPLLDFRLAHARARDAVYETLDEARLVAGLKKFDLPVVSVSSAAPDRKSYLMQPDLGRTLGRTPATDAEAIFGPYRGKHYDVAFVIADGLSACAVQDSMGIYLTWQSGMPRTDADRNCISNVRPEGLAYADAGFRLLHTLRAIRARGISGVQLKDDSDRLLIDDTRN